MAMLPKITLSDRLMLLKAQPKWILLGLLAIGLVGLFAWLALKPEEVLAVWAEPQDTLAFLTVTGEVRAHQDVALSAPFQAQITRLLVDEGDAVRAGQLLAELNPTEMTARLEQAESEQAQAQATYAHVLEGIRPETRERFRAQVAQSQAMLNQAMADAQNAQTTQADAQRNADRLKTLYQQDLISRQEFDRSQDQLKTASESLKKAMANTQAAQSQLWQSQHQLQEAMNGPTAAERQQAKAGWLAMQAQVQAMKAQRADRFLRSPVDGIVTRRLEKAGNVVMPGRPIVNLANPHTFEVVGFVEESDMPRVKLQARAYVNFDALPTETFEARVSKMGSEVNPENGTVEVTLQLSSLQQGQTLRLLPGMTADVNLVTDMLEHAWVLPASALEETRAGQGKPSSGQHIYVFENSQLVAKPVKARRISLEQVEIQDGLNRPVWVAKVITPALLQSIQQHKRVMPKQDLSDLAAINKQLNALPSR